MGIDFADYTVRGIVAWIALAAWIPAMLAGALFVSPSIFYHRKRDGALRLDSMSIGAFVLVSGFLVLAITNVYSISTSPLTRIPDPTWDRLIASYLTSIVLIAVAVIMLPIGIDIFHNRDYEHD